MDGVQVEGAVVLMDFNTGDAWLNSGYLGAGGVVFIEPDSTVYLEGERKFLTGLLQTPLFCTSFRCATILSCVHPTVVACSTAQEMVLLSVSPDTARQASPMVVSTL